MIRKVNLDIPAKSLGYMLVCGGIIVVLVLGLVSFHRYNVARLQDVKKIQGQIDEQKGLRDVYRLLHEAAGKKDDRALPNPAKTRLSRKQTDKFQDALRTEAAKAGLMTTELIPDVNTLAQTSQSLLYHATFKGELAGFRKLLAALGNFSYLEKIEEMDLRQYGDSMEFRLKMWVGLTRE
jgi:hypothetical protein